MDNLILQVRCHSSRGGRNLGYLIPGRTSLFDVLGHIYAPAGSLRGIPCQSWHLAYPTAGHLPQDSFLLSEGDYMHGPGVLPEFSDVDHPKLVELDFDAALTLQVVLFACYKHYRGINFQGIYIARGKNKLIITPDPVYVR